MPHTSACLTPVSQLTVRCERSRARAAHKHTRNYTHTFPNVCWRADTPFITWFIYSGLISFALKADIVRLQPLAPPDSNHVVYLEC